MAITKTFPVIVLKAAKALGNGNVTSHPPSSVNVLGQSGIHTFVDDVIDIVMNSNNEAHAYKRMWDYLQDGYLDISIKGDS